MIAFMIAIMTFPVMADDKEAINSLRESGKFLQGIKMFYQLLFSLKLKKMFIKEDLQTEEEALFRRVFP